MTYEPRISLTPEGERDLANAAGFETYEEFVTWKTEHADEYEAWYAELKRKSAFDD